MKIELAYQKIKKECELNEPKIFKPTCALLLDIYWKYKKTRKNPIIYGIKYSRIRGIIKNSNTFRTALRMLVYCHIIKTWRMPKGKKQRYIFLYTNYGIPIEYNQYLSTDTDTSPTTHLWYNYIKVAYHIAYIQYTWQI